MKASVWRSHPRHVPLFTVTMMGKKDIQGIYLQNIQEGGGV